MPRAGPANLPTTDVDVSTVPPSSEQDSLSLPINPEVRLTANLLACICNLRHKCMSKNVVTKNIPSLICVYYQEKGDGDENQVHRVQQFPYMSITHSTTGVLFESVTSDYNKAGDVLATHLSPWIKVSYAVSPASSDRKGGIIDDKEMTPLGSDGMFTEQSTEYFSLTAELMNYLPCQSPIPGSLSVSIHEESSIIFACTCDNTRSCHGLNFDLPDEGSNASVRICIIPQQGNDEAAAIVRITQLKLDKEGPCGFPFDVVSDGVVSPLATIEVEEVVGDDNPGVTMLVVTIELFAPQVLNPSPITVYGAVEVKQPDSQLKEVPFGTLRYAVAVAASLPPTDVDVVTPSPTNNPTVLPSSWPPPPPPSPGPTFNGPTFEPTQSNEPTEDQTMRLEHCPCDSNRKCLGADRVTLTQYERNIRICFKALPSTSQLVTTPLVISNLTLPFTTSLDSDMNGGLITTELPEEAFVASAGSAVEVLGKFTILEIGYVESSAYCSSSTSTTQLQLRACACQCDDYNNYVDGLVQTPSSRDVRICVFSAPTGTKIDQVDTLFLKYESSGDKTTTEIQLVIRDDEPADSDSETDIDIEPSVPAPLRIIKTSLKDDFFSDLTGSRIVEVQGSATVLPVDSGGYRQVVEINAVALTVMQELTPEPSRSPSSAPTTVPPTPVPSNAPTPQPTPFPTTVQPTPGPTSVPSNPPITMPTPQPTDAVTPSPSPTNAPKDPPSPGPTNQPSRSPTPNPSIPPTPVPTKPPSPPPTPNPSRPPSPGPTPNPTRLPTPRPTNRPSPPPTPNPSRQPTPRPTNRPSPPPTPNPSRQPTSVPTPNPSMPPSPEPTNPPSRSPTPNPSRQPSPEPTNLPSRSPTPTTTPSETPTSEPTNSPSQSPTTTPSKQPTPEPTPPPSRSPTPKPSMHPSLEPSVEPSSEPSLSPSTSSEPSSHPSLTPSQSAAPSSQPSLSLSSSGQPSFIPSGLPSTSSEPSSQPPSGSQTASYDESLGAPKCSVGLSCDSGTLLNGRGTMNGGNETNSPNTLNNCTDGNSGTYHIFESIDRIVVWRASGGEGDLTEGENVTITATVSVWCWSQFSNFIDFYYASDASNPVWTKIGNRQTCPGVDNQTLTASYTLPQGFVQAVRANMGEGEGETETLSTSTSTDSCTTGAFDDTDDLVITVRPTIAPQPQPSSKPSLNQSSMPSSSSKPSSKPSACYDTPNSEDLCSQARENYEPGCSNCDTDDCYLARQVCCYCGGGSSTLPPTNSPTTMITNSPSASAKPTSEPSRSTTPTPNPSNQLSAQPSSPPTITSKPSFLPSSQPSFQPSSPPTITSKPSFSPSSQPSSLPSSPPTITSKLSFSPSSQPSSQPSSLPTITSKPSFLPSSQPSSQPSLKPTSSPSFLPSSQPSSQPSWKPTSSPSFLPSSQPSLKPTSSPSSSPSYPPSSAPSNQPTSEPSSAPSTYRVAAIKTLLLSVSSKDALDDGCSSQGKAFLWVTSEDNQLQPGDDDAQIIQRYVLAVLFYATNGEGWTYGKETWLTSSNECDWYVVRCSNSMVTRFFLDNNNLSGTIPSELGSLTNLGKFGLFSC
eukprot:scaffold14141_cov146-Skeletonema_dohrnii-CCMP3373.AAC.3